MDKNIINKKTLRNNRRMNLVLFSTIYLFLIFIQNNVQAVVATVEEQRQAVITAAMAYKSQGVQIQYDSYRKNLYATPEDATKQRHIYTVCSGLTFQSYYQALGIKIPDTTEGLLDYAEHNMSNTSTVLLYFDTTKNIYSKNLKSLKNPLDYTEVTKKFIELAEPGDIFVVTRTCCISGFCG